MKKTSYQIDLELEQKYRVLNDVFQVWFAMHKAGLHQMHPDKLDWELENEAWVAFKEDHEKRT